MPTVSDDRFASLRAQGFTGATNDMLLQWLQANGATASTVPDAWREFLDLQGYAQGHRSDGWYDLLDDRAPPEIGRHINDLEAWFWDPTGGGGTVGDFVNAGGPYQVVEGEPVQLNGSALFEDDPSPTFLWEIVSGGTGTFLPSANVEDPTFTPDSTGAYVLRLTATGVPAGPLSDDADLTSLVYVPVTFGPVTVDPYDIAEGTSGTRETAPLFIPGNVGPIVYTLTGTAWPVWADIDADTGEITYTNATPVASSSGHTITATDGKGTPAVSNTFDINVVAQPVPVEFVGPDLGPYVAVIGDTLNVLAWQSFNGTEQPITFNQAGTAYPNGITVSVGGVLSGTFTGPTVNTTGSLVEANDAAANPPAFSNSIGFTVTAVNPTVDAGGPYAGDVDTPIAIDGASVTPGSDLSPDYLWTADLPGSFDDPTILSPTFTPTTEDAYTLTLTVTPTAGYGDPVADTAALTSTASGTLFQWDSQYSGIPETITNGAITFTAADARTAVDNAGYVIDVPAGASASYGQRLVVNLLAGPTDVLATEVVTVTAGRSYRVSFSGNGTVTLSGAATDSLVGTGGQRSAMDVFVAATSSLTVTVTGSVLTAQVEDVSGLANQSPAEYVSKGAESAPYYNGAFADGVQYFPYANPNTVTDNIVTENPPGPNYTSGFYCDAQGGLGISRFQGYTNLCLHSEDFSQVEWIKSGLTVGTTDNASPRGDSTATKLIATVASELKIFGQQYTSLSTGTAQTCTIYVKEAEYRYVQILGSVAGFGNGFVNYDLQTGLITNSNPGTSNIRGTALTPAADGWFRLTVSFTPLQATADVYFGPLETGLEGRAPVYTGNGTDGMLFWGGMFNAREFPPPYVKTDAAASIIGNERVTLTKTGNLEDAEGTFTATCQTFWEGVLTTGLIYNHIAATNNDNGLIYLNSWSDGDVAIRSLQNGVIMKTANSSNKMSEQPIDVAVTWDETGRTLYYDDISVSNVYSGSWGPDTLGIGNRGIDAGTELDGLIRFIKITNTVEPPS